MLEFDYDAALDDTPEGVWAGTATSKVFWVRRGSDLVPVATVASANDGAVWSVRHVHGRWNGSPETRLDFVNMQRRPARPHYLDWQRDLMVLWATHQMYFTHGLDRISEPCRPQ